MAALLVSLGGVLLTLGVASYGLIRGSSAVVSIGLAACVAIGAAMALRAGSSIRTFERTCASLDRALLDSERARDRLAKDNEDLARANLELRVMHTAFADLLNLADERSQGRMRDLIENTGAQLAELLEEELHRERIC